MRLMQEQNFELQELEAYRRQIFDAYIGLYRYFIKNKNNYTPIEQSEIKALFKEEYAAFGKDKEVYISAYRQLSLKQKIKIVLMLSAYGSFGFINYLDFFLHRAN